MKMIDMARLTPGAWIACKNVNSGYLLFNGTDFKAERSIDSYFSALGQGRKGPIGSPRRRDKSLAPEIYLLAAVRSKEINPAFAKRCRVAHCMSLEDGSDIEQLNQDADCFDEYAGAWFVHLVRVSENGVSIAGKWLDSIENQIRDLTDDEDDFIRSIEQAAEDAAGVPTQAAVRKLWLAKDCERLNRNVNDAFRDVRNILGFSWLPAARSARTGV